jgi:hypothetical protein
MIKVVFTGIAVSCLLVLSHAQDHTVRLGIEAQGYPTGIIVGISADFFPGEDSKIHLRFGYNLVRHGSAGEHFDERGGGIGITGGYDLMPLNSKRWVFGLRTDLWFNSIDWHEIYPNDLEERGTTDVTVLQPTAQVGLRVPLGKYFELIPNLSLGYEINIRTRGEEVGQGPIVLLGTVISVGL